MYSDQETLKYLAKLTWDTKQTPKDLLHILKSGENNREKKGLYIKILNWFPWHQVRLIVGEEKLPEVLADDVIQGLFPRDLRDKYRYVKSLL